MHSLLSSPGYRKLWLADISASLSPFGSQLKLMNVPYESESDIECRTVKNATLWCRYKLFAERKMYGDVANSGNIAYWRDKLFANFITYLLPTCFIALVPGVYMAVTNGYLFIGVFDILVVCFIAVVAFSARLSLNFQKFFVVIILYCLAVMLLIKISLVGPGVIYLLALSILITIILPSYWAYRSVWLNLLVCVGAALVIHLKLFHSALINDYSLGVWVAVSSNVVFLSWVLVLLISNAVEGLEQAINKEYKLRSELQIEMTAGTEKNEQIKESENQYRGLFFQNPAPMWVLDVESLRLLQVNDAAINSYGYTNEEFLLLTIMDIKLEDDMVALDDNINTAVATGGPLTVITRHRRKNKVQFDVEVIFNAILFKGKKATLVIVRDISQQVAQVQAIQQQNDKLRDIAHIQSHHVRAPLARILGFLNLINEEAAEKTDPQLLAFLNESALELDEVIREINRKTEV